MISGDERRRAADELREASTGAYRHVDALDVIAGSVGVDAEGKSDHEIERETYAALADHIDPTCEPEVRAIWIGRYAYEFTCSRCFSRFSDGTAGQWRYCPYCGARVVRPNGD